MATDRWTATPRWPHRRVWAGDILWRETRRTRGRHRHRGAHRPHAGAQTVAEIRTSLKPAAVPGRIMQLAAVLHNARIAVVGDPGPELVTATLTMAPTAGGLVSLPVLFGPESEP